MTTAKRLLDLSGAIVGMVVVSPLLLVLSIAVRVDSAGPIFFRQERVGLAGKRFRIWKLRTMVLDAERRGAQLTVGRDPRITRVGSFLRALKLDELPQLINVIRGDMSLVGPRPEVPRYVALYDDAEREVLKLLPGVTDPASILFRREAELLAAASDSEEMYVREVMPEKIRLNLAYARTATVWSDVQVIARTLISLGSREAPPLPPRAAGTDLGAGRPA